MRTIDKPFIPFAIIAGKADLREAGEEIQVIEGVNFKSYKPAIHFFDKQHGTSSPSADVVSFEHTFKTNNVDFIDGNSQKGNMRRGDKVVKLTYGDLLLDPIRVVLNFTGDTILCSKDDGQPKIYEPLKGGKFIKDTDLENKLVVLEYRTWNNPDAVKAMMGVDNYLEEMLLPEEDNIPNSFYKRTMYNHITFLKEKIAEAKERNNYRNHSSIAVYSIMVFNKYELEDLNKGKELYIPSIGTTLSKRSITELSPSPGYVSKSVDMGVVRSLREYPLTSYFLNDPSNRVIDRYAFVVDRAMLIPRVTLSGQVDGLYRSVTRNTEIVTEFIMSLDDFTKSDDFYDTEEEALNRIRTKDRMAVEVEMESLDVRRHSNNTQLEAMQRTLETRELQRESVLEKKLLDMGELMLKMEANRERDRQELISIEDKRRRDMDTWRMEMERDYNKNKADVVRSDRRDYYEERSYRRSDSLETLKTVAAVAGVIGTGYVILNKLSK